jgi:hypothetical protein
VLGDSDLTVMEITSADGSTSALFEVQDEVDNATSAKSELIFNKYGNRYLLAKLFDEGNPNGSQVVKSRYEKRISQAAAEAQAHVPAPIGNDETISGPLKQQLPERQRAVRSRAKSFVSESQKRRKYEIAKSCIRFDRNDVVVRGQFAGTAGDDRLRSRRKLRAIQDQFVGTH